jgi:hypothetical protein
MCGLSPSNYTTMANEHLAFMRSGLPCNPTPFATALLTGVRENGMEWIESDEAKAILWVLMTQAYNSCGCLHYNQPDEWERLFKVFKAQRETA